jgi:putative transposase
VEGEAVKEWLTAAEIALERLGMLPTSERGVQKLATAEGWNDNPVLCRARAGRGGGIEYHIKLLPPLARLEYEARHRTIGAPAEQPAPIISLPATARAQSEMSARLAVVAAFDGFRSGQRLSTASCEELFVAKYNGRALQIQDWVLDLVPRISKRSLARWRAAKVKGCTDQLAVDRSAAKKGKGILDVAERGRVRTFVLGLIAQQPHLSGAHLRKMIRSEFGDLLTVDKRGEVTRVPVPPVRTIQHFVAALKETEQVLLTKLTNPDRYRSTMAPAGVGTYRWVTEPNTLWMIDASPTDALCQDGRHAIYACIDIATRRTVLYASRTPRASAVALLVRKAILQWGCPKTIKTDNGSDFTAQATQQLFQALGIEVELSDPYQPQQKGHVERVIRTFQHEVGPLLPGYIGHSVADRKAIEDRRSFADRLGAETAELFQVSLTGAALQRYADEWVEVTYQHREHQGLKGRSPFAAAAASTVRPRMVDVRALDLLLMPLASGGGLRSVTKLGIRIDDYHYIINEAFPKDRVQVRMDPLDAGRAYAFDADTGTFVGEAICPELAGLDPSALLAAKKAATAEILDLRGREARAEAKRLTKGKALIERVLEVDRRDLPNVVAFPRREDVHSTPAIEAAIEAMEAKAARPAPTSDPRIVAEQARLAALLQAQEEAEAAAAVDAIVDARQREIAEARIAHLPAEVTPLPESPRERYRRAYQLIAAFEAGEVLDTADAIWLGRYQNSAEYSGHKRLHDLYGDEFLA